MSLQYFFEPNSERIRRFDLFEETSAPHLEFANASVTLEGAKALADRYGFLHRVDRPGYALEWYNAIREMHDAVHAWQSAKATGDFSRLIRSIARQAKRSIGKPDDSGIDANILLSKDPLSGEPRLCIRPSTLLDALWTKLALAIDGSEFCELVLSAKNGSRSRLTGAGPTRNIAQMPAACGLIASARESSNGARYPFCAPSPFARHGLPVGAGTAFRTLVGHWV